MAKIPLSVVLMVHNEESTIKQEVMDYYRFVCKKIDGSEMIIVDDANSDNTGKILKILSKKLPLRIIMSKAKLGYASSLRLCLDQARGDYVFYADTGKKHDPRDFWKLYKYRNAFGLISGQKKPRHDPWFRLLLAGGLNKLVNFYFGVSFSDIDSGFKLLDKKTVSVILQKPWRLKDNISLEVVLRASYAGIKTKEVAVKHFKREGESHGIPVKKIPSIILSLLSNFPKLKKDLLDMHRLGGEKKMISNYDKLFITHKYRMLWEGKISVVYKLPKYLQIIKKFLSRHSNIHSVLEVGCGDGEIAENILKDKSIAIDSYTATELSQGGLLAAEKKLNSIKSARVIKADVLKLPFTGNSFEYVLSFDVMHHVSEPSRMASELVRVGKKRILLIESNGLSVVRKIAEMQKRYKQMGEKSYLPWQYRHFFSLPKVKSFRIYPFLFMFPHCPHFLIPLNIFISELLEKLPILNWQCSGVVIEVELKN